MEREKFDWRHCPGYQVLKKRNNRKNESSQNRSQFLKTHDMSDSLLYKSWAQAIYLCHEKILELVQ